MPTDEEKSSIMKNRWYIEYFEGYKISCTSGTEDLVESLTNSKCKSLPIYNLCCKISIYNLPLQLTSWR